MIIFNADDYALTEIDVSRVHDAIKFNIIQSTTAVANGAGNIALPMLHSISSGIHINLVEGRSLTNPASLTNDDGHFFSKSELLLRVVTGRVKAVEIEAEVAAQFELLIRAGVSISHIDTHQNIHIAPSILSTLIRVGEDFNVRKIRGQRSEYGWFGSYSPLRMHLKNTFSIYWHNLIPKNWVATERIILNAPGLGREISSINQAVSMWEMALVNHYRPEFVYEVPCHLYLSEFEFELYTSPEFAAMMDRLKIKIGGYHDI